MADAHENTGSALYIYKLETEHLTTISSKGDLCEFLRMGVEISHGIKVQGREVHPRVSFGVLHRDALLLPEPQTHALLALHQTVDAFAQQAVIPQTIEEDHTAIICNAGPLIELVQVPDVLLGDGKTVHK